MTHDQQRKLAAILAADIAGYSALMGADDEGTVRDLKGHQSVVLPMIGEFGGRIIDTAGDGILAEFASVLKAVNCAVAVQKTMAGRNATVAPTRRMQFRIGINLGDIIYDEARVYGDGVNIAARLESIAEPGGICVSDKVYQEMRGKIDVPLRDLGLRTLKNISEPTRVYSIDVIGVPEPPTALYSAPKELGLALPDKPSIAVMPFQNMSGDPEQEYFADGIVEDITTALTRLPGLFVVGRGSSFTYKNRTVSVQQVGGELGVRYVLQGSVRKATNYLRIAGQLVNASNGTHIWADQFEGFLDDLFGLQDRVTRSVVGQIAPKLEQAEIERARLKPTERLDAYDHYLRGLFSFYQWDKEGLVNALRQFQTAAHLDPAFATAHAMASWCYTRRKANSWMGDAVQESCDAIEHAHRAVELGREDAVALCVAGFSIAYVSGDLENSVSFIDRGLSRCPSLGTGWTLSGWVRAWRGESDIALEHLERAMRLSPLDPLMYFMEAASSLAHFFAGRYDLASTFAERSLRQQPNFFPAVRFAAASHALAGRQIEAERLMGRLRKFVPSQRMSNLRDVAPFRHAEDFEMFARGLQRAGLPD